MTETYALKPFTLCRIGVSERVALIQQARVRILFCSPGLSACEINALVEAKRRLPAGAMHLLVDLQKATLNCGYWGDLDSEQLSKLHELTDCTELAPGFRLAIIVADDCGYLYTPIAESVDDEISRGHEPNALLLNPEEIIRLLDSIVIRPVLSVSSENETQAKTVKVPLRAALDINMIDEAAQELATHALPNTSRIHLTKFLQQKMKIVQFEVGGYKLTRRKLQLPKEVSQTLAAQDEQIAARLNATWQVFADGTGEELDNLQKGIETDLQKIKKTYLVSLGHYGYAFTVDEREKYEKAWHTFQKDKVDAYKQAVNAKVQQLIDQSKDILAELLIQNIRDGKLEIVNKPSLILRSEAENLQSFVKRLVDSVKWPTIADLTNSIVVKYRLYDVTVELLDDEEFITQLCHAFKCSLDDLIEQLDEHPDKLL